MISKCKSSELICEIGTAPETTTASNIGITDPTSGTGSLLGILPCSAKTIVTSGTYERYFEVDGVKYHHMPCPQCRKKAWNWWVTLTDSRRFLSMWTEI